LEKKILCIEKVSFTAEFDDNVESITFFVSTKNKIFSTEKIIKRSTVIEDFDEEKNLFNVFITDSLTNGIADKKGNIIIPEQKQGLSKSSNFYYYETKDGKEVLNWLDVENKKLVALPHFSSHSFSINENIDVFYDHNHNPVVYKNRKDPVLKTTYSSILKFGDFIFCENSNKILDIYDTHLNKITNKNISYCEVLSKKHTLLKVEKNNKHGVMNSKLNFIIPVEYTSIEPFPQNESLFIISKKQNDEDLYGLVNYKGEAVTDLDFSYISEYISEKRIIVKKDGKYGFLDENGKIAIALKFDKVELFLNGFAIIEMNGKKGFINKNGDIIIQPKYSHCNDFKGGYAFVFTKDSYGIINKKGDFVMKVNKKVSPEKLSVKNYGRNTIYLIDNLIYDYNGNIMK
jgi:hypothetical protein